MVTGSFGQMSAIAQTSEPSMSTRPLNATTATPGKTRTSTATSSSPMANTIIGSWPENPAT